MRRISVHIVLLAMGLIMIFLTHALVLLTVLAIFV